jgi:hypothetical protein
VDSTTSPKVKTTEREGEEVGARSLARSILGIEGRAGAPRWGLRRLTRNSITHMDLQNQTTSWLVSSWNILVHG